MFSIITQKRIKSSTFVEKIEKKIIFRSLNNKSDKNGER